MRMRNRAKATRKSPAVLEVHREYFCAESGWQPLPHSNFSSTIQTDHLRPFEPLVMWTFECRKRWQQLLFGQSKQRRPFSLIYSVEKLFNMLQTTRLYALTTKLKPSGATRAYVRRDSQFSPAAPSTRSSRRLSAIFRTSTVPARLYSDVPSNQSAKDAAQKSFMGTEEFRRLVNKDEGTIDESGNYKAPGGVSMPTQSSGGLTKRNNTDISELDIFGGEGAVITAYSESGFVINEEYLDGSLLSYHDKFWSWTPTNMDEITMENLAPIWLHNPTPRTYLLTPINPLSHSTNAGKCLTLLNIPAVLLVLGTGPTLIRPSEELLKFLLVRGIATEIGSTVRPLVLLQTDKGLFYKY